MFESISPAGAAARMRTAALPPVIAIALTLAYLTAYPLLPRVPPFLFWTIVLVLLAGTIAGAVFIVHEVRRERPRGTAIGWLAGAVLLELLCARLLLWFTVPWL